MFGFISTEKTPPSQSGVNTSSAFKLSHFEDKFENGFSLKLENLRRKPRTFSPWKFIKSNTVLLLAIILIGIFLRIYQLDKYPIQLGHDEVTQLYDAISIAQTGKDIYGNFMPTIFESIHDFKPPFYTYATALTYLIIGDHEITIRIPGVLFGILIIPAIFLFSLKLFKNRPIALLASFITAIAPFEIFYSRKSFESGAGVFCLLIGFGLLLHFLQNFNKKRWLYLSIIFLAIGMYTYFSNVVLTPFLLMAFIFIFRKNFRNAREYINPILFWFILIVPLILIVTTNPDSAKRSKDVSLIKDVELGQQLGLINLSNGLTSFLYQAKTISDYGFNRYLRQLDPVYLFGNGLDLTNQGPMGMGPLYLAQLIFLLIGLTALLKSNKCNGERGFILVWILIGMIPSGLTFEDYSPHRSLMVFTMLNIITGIGVFTVIDFFYQRNIYKVMKLTIWGFLLTLFLLNFLYFEHIYFVNFPFEKSQSLHYPFEKVAQFAWENYDNFDQIIFDPNFGEVAPVIGVAAHYYMGYYGHYPPSKFQQEYHLGNKSREVIFDKFSIRAIKWGEDKNLHNTLILASPAWSIPKDDLTPGKVIKTFYFYNHQIAFYAVALP